MLPKSSSNQEASMPLLNVQQGQRRSSLGSLLVLSVAMLLLCGASLVAMTFDFAEKPNVLPDPSSQKAMGPINVEGSTAFSLAIEASAEPPTTAKVATSVNSFGLALMKAVYMGIPGEGVFLSPIGVASALSMLALGATNESRVQRELLTALALNYSSMPVFFNVLQSSTKVGDSDVQLLNANSVWSTGIVKKTYIETAKRALNATARPLPHDPTPINDWCGKATKGMIPSILTRLDSTTAAILVNAIYFKGIWSDQFEKRHSAPSLFMSADGHALPCTMMKRNGDMLYAEVDGTQIVDLPYGKKGTVAATVLLPPAAEPSALASLVTRFGAAGGARMLESWLSQLRQTTVALQLPRFRMEFGVHDMKKELMSSFGIREAFEGSEGFLAMSDDRRLHFSSMLHKAVVEVNEEGTKAAAVSAVNAGLAIGPSVQVSVMVDRPFLFLIRSKHHGLLLFAGAVEKPSFD